MKNNRKREWGMMKVKECRRIVCQGVNSGVNDRSVMKVRGKENKKTVC